MQVSHLISDVVLTSTGFYVFFSFISKLNLTNTVLWESFVLSVTAAALFGSIRFAGFENAAFASTFFQNIAKITGGVGLAAAAFAAVFNLQYSKILCYSILSIGFVLFALSEGLGVNLIGLYTPIISMVVIFILGILALFKNKTKIGVWLILGVIFFALGTFRDKILGNVEYSTDIYHYLSAAGLLSFGSAAKAS
jgi:hypothetical protein